jgi:hypothetical protein
LGAVVDDVDDDVALSLAVACGVLQERTSPTRDPLSPGIKDSKYRNKGNKKSNVRIRKKGGQYLLSPSSLL